MKNTYIPLDMIFANKCGLFIFSLEKKHNAAL